MLQFCKQVTLNSNVNAANNTTQIPEEESMFTRRLIVIFILLCSIFAPSAVQAKSKNTGSSTSSPAISCQLPESNAEALVILNNYYPGYWWDHTDLTIAVKAHPSTTDAQWAAIRGALATWSNVFADCFDGAITLTDVTGQGRNPQQAADIVVHFVPRAGGVVFGGYAICGDHGCPNILVRSDLPPSLDREPYSPEYIGWVTLHEVGHALGLGHTTNLLESTDLMGYGWPDLGEPVLSDCDIDALAFIFAWVFEGGEPHPPGAGPYNCSQS